MGPFRGLFNLNYDLLVGAPDTQPITVCQSWTAWDTYRVAWSIDPDMWDPKTQATGPRWVAMRARAVAAARTWIVASPDLCVHFLESLAAGEAKGTPQQLEAGERSALELLEQMRITTWPLSNARKEAERPNCSYWDMFHEPIEYAGRGRRCATSRMVWAGPEIRDAERREGERAADAERATLMAELEQEAKDIRAGRKRMPTIDDDPTNGGMLNPDGSTNEEWLTQHMGPRVDQAEEG